MAVFSRLSYFQWTTILFEQPPAELKRSILIWNGSFKSKRTCSTCSRPAGSKGRFISHRGLTSRFLSEVPARQIKATHKGARLRLTEKPRLQPRECVTKPGNISQGSGAGLWRIQTLCRTRRSSGRCR